MRIRACRAVSDVSSAMRRNTVSVASQACLARNRATLYDVVHNSRLIPVNGIRVFGESGTRRRKE